MDGSEIEGSTDRWPELPAEGVDWVQLVLSDGAAIQMHAASLYWLYPEGDGVVIGEGMVAYDPKAVREVVVSASGEQEERFPEHLPDLAHQDIKLGWYWT